MSQRIGDWIARRLHPRQWLRDDGEKPPKNTQEAGSSEIPETQLYTCPDCETTYIGIDIERCSECDEPVERTPTFAELGIDIRGKS